jgi:hypothetical protein
MEIKNSNNLIDDLINFGISQDPKPNFIILPVGVYNLIEEKITFLSDETRPSDIAALYKVGYIMDFEVYIDIHLSPDKIVMSWNKQSMRDNKINSILGESMTLNNIEINII